MSYDCEFPANYPDGVGQVPDPSKNFTLVLPISSTDAIHSTKEVKDILERYLDPQVITRINQGDYHLFPRNKTITIVFWDIRGFSFICELLKAKQK